MILIIFYTTMCWSQVDRPCYKMIERHVSVEACQEIADREKHKGNYAYCEIAAVKPEGEGQ